MRLKSRPAFQLIIAISLIVSGCSNFLEPLSNKESDEAIYEDAIKLMDKSDFTGSLAKFDQLGSGFASQVEVKEKWAGALAGKCGFTFLSFFERLSLLGTNPFFKFMMNTYTGTAVVPASCIAAEAKIKEIWATSSKTQGQKLFMAMLSLAKIGAILRSNVDKDAGGLGNGSADSRNAYCQAAGLSDQNVKEILVGFSLFMTNITDFTSQIGGAATAVDDLNTTICSNPLTQDLCLYESTGDVTDPKSITAARQILDTTDYGFAGDPACDSTAINPIVPGPCCP